MIKLVGFKPEKLTANRHYIFWILIAIFINIRRSKNTGNHSNSFWRSTGCAQVSAVRSQGNLALQCAFTGPETSVCQAEQVCWVMKIYVCLLVLFSVVVALLLRLLDLSWPLSLIGGLLAFSGSTILLLGFSVQRLLSDQGEKAGSKNFFSLILKGKSSKTE
ncbi:MAG: hypothetical protein CMN90_15225 [Sutterellaceae bacterium]|nr:hypothetical protein [Sutterellaceae bacterium]